MRSLVVVALGLVALAACEATPARTPPVQAAVVAPAQPRVDATPLLEKFQCNRCHVGTGLAEVETDKHCVRCHQQILAKRYEAPADVLARWGANLTSLRVVPSLTGVGTRLRRDWIADFLVEPHDLRPMLPATMPRFAITRVEAQQLAAHLVPTEVTTPVTFTDHERRRGGELYSQLHCNACHRFTGSATTDAPLEPKLDAHALAPDLAHARTRLQRAAVVDLIADPTRHNPDAHMPKLGISTADARALAAFVLDTPLSAALPRPRPARLPILERDVTWAEVSEQVFRKVCWHCHSTPEYALGDGGPGNTGGFGFAARGLDLSRHSGIMAGAYGEDGRRRGIFTPTADGTPRLVAVLLARQAEEAGQPGALRGMPLGLPALTPEQIQLVETWIAQGRRN